MVRRVELFRCLQGVLSFYKPPGQDTSEFQRRIALKISNGLMVLLTQFPSSLVIGRRFVPSDVVLNPVDPLPNFATGLQLFGVGELGAYGFTDVLYKQRLPKSYHLTGMFGQASSDGLSTGSVIYRSPWRHITRPKLDRILAAIEFKARSASLLQAGLVPNTQKTFEVLSNSDPNKWPVKPLVEPCEFLPADHVTAYWDRRSEPTQPHSLRAKPDPSSLRQLPPFLQAIRCINFEPPFFTLEIQVAYETADFLTDLMVNIGASLRSSCVLSGARRIRHGPFTVRDSLLLKQCTIPQALYERFAELRSKPPEKEFENEDQYRHHVLTQVAVDEEANLFSNLTRCTLNEEIKNLIYVKE